MFGQGIAFAMAPASQATEAATMAAGSDCMKVMQEDPDGEPCKGITLECIQAMGCVVPFTLADTRADLIAPLTPAGVQFGALAVRLKGRVPPPEPEPPAS